MAQDNQDNIEQDPTMEEILQSIKRIISDDEPAAEVVKPAAQAEPAPKSKAQEIVEHDDSDEVLELTDMVKDDGTIVNLKDSNVRDILDDIDDLTKAIEEADANQSAAGVNEKAALPEEPVFLEEVTVEPAAEEFEATPQATEDAVAFDEEEFVEELPTEIEEDFAMVPPSSAESGDAGLVSEESADATKDAFKKFIDALPIMRPNKITGDVSTRSGTTIEDLLMESMRPLLKEWLDNHLPETVERIVREELQRLMPR